MKKFVSFQRKWWRWQRWEGWMDGEVKTEEETTDDNRPTEEEEERSRRRKKRWSQVYKSSRPTVASRQVFGVFFFSNFIYLSFFFFLSFIFLVKNKAFSVFFFVFCSLEFFSFFWQKNKYIIRSVRFSVYGNPSSPFWVIAICKSSVT